MLKKRFEECEQWLEHPIDQSHSAIILTDLFHPEKEGSSLGYSLAHLSVKPGDRTLRSIFQKATDLIYILQGKATIEIDDKTVHLEEKQLLLIPAGKKRCVINSGDIVLEFLSITEPPFQPNDCLLLEEASITPVVADGAI